MHVNDVLDYCKEHGRPCSKQLLYQSGRKWGFITSSTDDDWHLQLDMDGFLKWFNMYFEEPPEGYLNVKQLVDRYGVCIAYVYIFIKDPRCKTVKVGRKRVAYVDPAGFEEVVADHRAKRKYGRN